MKNRQELVRIASVATGVAIMGTLLTTVIVIDIQSHREQSRMMADQTAAINDMAAYVHDVSLCSDTIKQMMPHVRVKDDPQ